MVNGVKQTEGPVQAANGGGLLDSDNVAKRWLEVGDALARLMSWMDSQETWLSKKGDLELLDVLNQLITLSESADAVKEMQKPAVASQLACLLAWVETSRFFRLLELMDLKSPNFVNRLVLALGRVGGEAAVYADLFFERVMLIHKGELLGRVFGEGRTHSIAETIRIIRETRHE